jgi:hypothetical protein
LRPGHRGATFGRCRLLRIPCRGTLTTPASQGPRHLPAVPAVASTASRLERAAKLWALEVLRFHPLYPAIVDVPLMRSILVEARIRVSMGEADGRLDRRDGVLYL